MKFRIGHGAYSGANALTFAGSYREALQTLLRRKVWMAEAHKALKEAIRGSNATCSTMSKSRINGQWFRMNVVEVVAEN